MSSATEAVFTADRINAHLRAGGVVQVTTMTRSTVYEPRHAGMFRDGRDGLYVQRGRHYDYLGPAHRPLVGIRLGRYVDA